MQSVTGGIRSAGQVQAQEHQGCSKQAATGAAHLDPLHVHGQLLDDIGQELSPHLQRGDSESIGGRFQGSKPVALPLPAACLPTRAPALQLGGSKSGATTGLGRRVVPDAAQDLLLQVDAQVLAPAPLQVLFLALWAWVGAWVGGSTREDGAASQPVARGAAANCVPVPPLPPSSVQQLLLLLRRLTRR